MKSRHVTNFLLTLYYVSFIWLSLLFLAGLLVLVIAGIETYIAFSDLYIYKWHNYLAFLFILLRFIGGILLAKKNVN